MWRHHTRGEREGKEEEVWRVASHVKPWWVRVRVRRREGEAPLGAGQEGQ